VDSPVEMCDLCFGSMMYGFVVGLVGAWMASRLFRKRKSGPEIVGLDSGCGGNCSCKKES